jgi:hypothetical protein
MKATVLKTVVVVGFLAAASGFATAMPAAPAATLGKDFSQLRNVTFWGIPFPYRYNGWSVRRACTEYVVVETPRGPRKRAVWVCDGRRVW